LSEQQPTETAIKVSAVLEDAYIWLLKNNKKNDE